MVVVAGGDSQGVLDVRGVGAYPREGPAHRVHLRFQAHAHAEEGEGDGGSGSRWRHPRGAGGLPPVPFNPPGQRTNLCCLHLYTR